MRSYFTFFLAVFSSAGFSQVNGFAKITGIASNVLTVSNVNQTNGSFAVGGKAIVIQMQGATITGNTGNNASFGIPNSLNSAGLYEVVTISAINGATTQITLTGPLVNSYSTAGSLQIVTFPQLGTTSFNTTANINCTGWNGNVGGVIAFYVTGNLNLFHNIDANSDGFRGGNVAGNDGSGCETNTYITATGDAKYADKGEGLYITAAGERSGRAKAVNGGGGGIVHNGGGGGGGNFTAGGNGYYGYTGSGYCSATTNAGGQGGLAVSSSGARVFMGGGGGGGQENNGLGSDGADGGGIILIKCDTIVLAGACGSENIRSNGGNAGNGSNDGCGGGGAGGTIVLDIKGIRAIGGCPLTISANGGDGGDVNDGASHGSGGGGGQGAVYIAASGPFANTTITTNNGAGGASNNGGSPPTAGSGGGTSGSGIATGPFSGPLPVELTFFRAVENGRRMVQLEWQTISETNNKEFEIYHLENGGEWQLIGTRQGAGTSASVHNYSFLHTNPGNGINYYKLRQIDLDQHYKYSDVIYFSFTDDKVKVKVYPNPTSGEFYIEAEQDLSSEKLFLINSVGERIDIKPEKKDNLRYTFDFSHLPKGIYLLYSQYISEKIILK